MYYEGNEIKNKFTHCLIGLSTEPITEIVTANENITDSGPTV